MTISHPLALPQRLIRAETPGGDEVGVLLGLTEATSGSRAIWAFRPGGRHKQMIIPPDRVQELVDALRGSLRGDRDQRRVLIYRDTHGGQIRVSTSQAGQGRFAVRRSDLPCPALFTRHQMERLIQCLIELRAAALRDSGW